MKLTKKKRNRFNKACIYPFTYRIMTKFKIQLIALSFILGSLSGLAPVLPGMINFYADDVGYGDPSYYNEESAYRTSLLDRYFLWV